MQLCRLLLASVGGLRYLFLFFLSPLLLPSPPQQYVCVTAIPPTARERDEALVYAATLSLDPQNTKVGTR